MSDKRSLASMIEHDHEALHETMHTIAALMSPPSEGTDFAAWKLDVLWKLRDFQNDLQKHFDLEEESAYKEELLRAAPQMAPKLDHLEEEHRKIISDLNHILDVVKDIRRADNPVIGRLGTRVQVVIDCLEAHEAEERTLIQDVFYQDYGVGD